MCIRDSFEGILAHVSRDQIMFAATIKSQAPGVPQSVSINLRTALALVFRKRIIGGDAIRRAVIHIDTQDLALKLGGVLSIALGGMATANVVLISAIADGNVEIAIG